MTNTVCKRRLGQVSETFEDCKKQTRIQKRSTNRSRSTEQKTPTPGGQEAFPHAGHCSSLKIRFRAEEVGMRRGR